MRKILWVVVSCMMALSLVMAACTQPATPTATTTPTNTPAPTATSTPNPTPTPTATSTPSQAPPVASDKPHLTQCAKGTHRYILKITNGSSDNIEGGHQLLLPKIPVQFRLVA